VLAAMISTIAIGSQHSTINRISNRIVCPYLFPARTRRQGSCPVQVSSRKTEPLGNSVQRKSMLNITR
jgi:hypothetical protein